MEGKILIVDDDPSICALCQDALACEDYDISTASNGKEALELARQKNFDVVLSDIKMPYMNGIELLDSLKKLEPGPTVILFSGFGDEHIAVESLKQGAFDYVDKPLSLDELKITIQKALAQSKSRNSGQGHQKDSELNEARAAALEQVQTISILQNFDTELVEEFLGLGAMQPVETHESMVREGFADNNLYIIMEGEVSVWQSGAELFRLKIGDCYGEMSIFRPNVRSQSLIAETPVQAIVIDKNAILGFFSQKEEKLFKLFFFNTLNCVYSKLRRVSHNVLQLERMLKK
ncbi:MAG: response regulator [bacterium]